MGWFSKKKSCDWCGETFTGDGCKDGELVLCGQKCFDEKNAPPIVAAPAPPPITPDGVDADLHAASGSFEACQAAFEAWAKAPDEEQRQALASQLALDESNAWRQLAEAAQGLGALGVDATAFDPLFQQYTSRPNSTVSRMRFPGYQAEFEAAARLLTSLLEQLRS